MSASEVLLQSCIQPKVAWDEVRRIGWIGEACPTKLVKEKECSVHGMGRSIVHMDEVASVHSCMWPPPVVSLVEAGQNCLVHVLVNCLWQLHKFIINHPL